MSATNYPKDELTFFSTELTIDEMVKHYKFQELMAMFLYGKNTSERIDYILKNNLSDVFKIHPLQLVQDKLFIETKTFVIKMALERMSACEVVALKTISNVSLIFKN